MQENPPIGTFAIEQGIPIPPKRGPTLDTAIPLDMKVNDSFYVAPELCKRTSIHGSLLKRVMDQRGWRFTIRREGEGTRVWRIQ